MVVHPYKLVQLTENGFSGPQRVPCLRRASLMWAGCMAVGGEGGVATSVAAAGG